MGAGLAKQIKDWCPQHYKDYKSICDSNKPSDLLGNTCTTRYSAINLICGVFGQLNYGRNGCYTDYDAVRLAFQNKKETVNNLFWQYPNCRFAVPYNYGCGLAGGDWNKILGIFVELFENTMNDSCPITLEIWKFNGDRVVTIK